MGCGARASRPSPFTPTRLSESSMIISNVHNKVGPFRKVAHESALNVGDEIKIYLSSGGHFGQHNYPAVAEALVAAKDDGDRFVLQIKPGTIQTGRDAMEEHEDAFRRADEYSAVSDLQAPQEVVLTYQDKEK